MQGISVVIGLPTIAKIAKRQQHGSHIESRLWRSRFYENGLLAGLDRLLDTTELHKRERHIAIGDSRSWLNCKSPTKCSK
jgi:hypothetical protein